MSEKSKLFQRSTSANKSNNYGSIKYEPLEPHRVRTHFTKRDCLIVFVVLAIAVTAIIVTLSLGLPRIQEKRARYLNTSTIPSPSPLRHFKSTVVLADAEPCAPIGKDILQKGGSGVDAAVALLFCNGAANLQSMGLGGGVFITIYNRTTGTAEVIDGREVAPQKASKDMFNGNATLSKQGALAVAVPGELKAYWVAHQRHGRLNWSELVLPTVTLCKEGIKVSRHLASKIQKERNSILNEPSLKELLFNNETGDLYKEGEVMKRPRLAATLQLIAEQGEKVFYDGQVGQNFVKDLDALGGIITLDDLKSYQAKVRTPSKSVLSTGDIFYSVPPPGSGPVLSLILNILSGYNMNSSVRDSIDQEVLLYHRIIEAFKTSYAKRTYLGDEDFVDVKQLVADMTSMEYAESLRKNISDDTTWDPMHYGPFTHTAQDHGTAQVSVFTKEGDAVSATSTINYYFGAMIRSTSTGILYNNEMDDFSSPNITSQFGVEPSEPNFIVPGKRPLSSMCPGVVVRPSKEVHMVIGGAGGTRITTGSALVMYRNLFLGETVKEAIDEPRIHHQLYPNKVFYEKIFPRIILDRLKKLGHEVTPETQASAIQGIINTSEDIEANLDYRKGGSLEGY